MTLFFTKFASQKTKQGPTLLFYTLLNFTSFTSLILIASRIRIRIHMHTLRTLRLLRRSLMKIILHQFALAEPDHTFFPWNRSNLTMHSFHSPFYSIPLLNFPRRFHFCFLLEFVSLSLASIFKSNSTPSALLRKQICSLSLPKVQGLFISDASKGAFKRTRGLMWCKS